MPPHHLHRGASGPISSLGRTGALALSGAAPEESMHTPERYVVERVVTDGPSPLTRAAAHHVAPPKLAGGAREGHGLGKQRARQSFELFNVDAHSLCLLVFMPRSNSPFQSLAATQATRASPGQIGIVGFRVIVESTLWVA